MSALLTPASTSSVLSSAVTAMSTSAAANVSSDTSLKSSNHQYLHPDFIQPLYPTTLNTKKSPLALLAQTCNNIGKVEVAKPLPPPLATDSILKIREPALSKPSLPVETATTAATAAVKNILSVSPFQANPIVNHSPPGGQLSPPNLKPYSLSNLPSPLPSAAPSAGPPLLSLSPQHNLVKTVSQLSPIYNAAALSPLLNPAAAAAYSSLLAAASPPHHAPVTNQSPLEALAAAAQIASMKTLQSSLMDPLAATTAYYNALNKSASPSSICRDQQCTGCLVQQSAAAAVAAKDCSECTSKKSLENNFYELLSHVHNSHQPTTSVTGATQNPDYLLPYTCNWMSDSAPCGKRFASQELLMIHVQTHTASLSPPAPTSSVSTAPLPSTNPFLISPTHQSLKSTHPALNQSFGCGHSSPTHHRPNSISPKTASHRYRYQPYSRLPSALPTVPSTPYQNSTPNGLSSSLLAGLGLSVNPLLASYAAQLYDQKVGSGLL